MVRPSSIGIRVQEDLLTVESVIDSELVSADMLPLDEEDIMTLERNIKEGCTFLVGLPLERRIETIFQVLGSDQYIYVDAPIDSRESDRARIFIGSDGVYRSIGVRSRGGKPKKEGCYTYEFFTTANGGRLNIPDVDWNNYDDRAFNPDSQYKLPSWRESRNSDEIDLEFGRLPRDLAPRLKVLRELGIDEKEYLAFHELSFRTAFEIFLHQE
jgi:hypothetical protein